MVGVGAAVCAGCAGAEEAGAEDAGLLLELLVVLWQAVSPIAAAAMAEVPIIDFLMTLYAFSLLLPLRHG